MKRATFTHLGLGAAVIGVIAGTAWAALTLTDLTTRHGHDPQSRAGSALAIFDLDGDGNNDLLVGAPGYEGGDPPGDNQNTDSSGDQPDGPTGEVLIYRGTPTGPEDEPFIVLHGEGPGDRFGAAIQVGDVTGDGTPDVIVSAILASGHDAPRTGCIYVFDGTGVNSGSDELGAHDAVAEVCGSQYREHFGRALAIGEFDDHMGLDIAVGAPWYSAAHSHADPGHPYEKYLAGAVYLVSNEEIAMYMDGLTEEIHAPLTAGEGWTAAYGENLLWMGDIDAASPGVDELLIFATGAENHGHSGKGRANLVTWDPMPHPGETEPEGFETPMVVIRGTGTLGSGDPTFLGDLNLDGIHEIGMPSSTGSGTPAAGTDTNSAGGLYIVNGDLMSFTPYVPATDTTPEAGVNDLGDVSLAAITGELAQDKFGTSMAALADLDGGDTPDFAVGAPWADGAVDAGGGTLVRSVISGSVYVLRGEDIQAATGTDRFKFKIRDSSFPAPLLGEILGRSNDRLGETLLSGPLLPSPTTQLAVGAPDREDNSTSLATDVPGMNSNDNRGTVFIGSPSYVP